MLGLFNPAINSNKISLVMRKPDFCICENKATDKLRSNYAPNFEKVDGAYCFWSVRALVRGWVTLFVPTVSFFFFFFCLFLHLEMAFSQI